MPPVTNFFEAVVVSVAAALMTFLSFIPALIGAVLILVVGWVLSGIVARVVTTLLERIGFETAAQRTGVTDFMSRTGMRDARASMVIGELVKWFIRLIFLEAAVSAIHLTAVTQIINQLILFIPNLIVALIVLMVGVMLARFVAGLVRGGASEAGIGSPALLAAIAQYTIIGLAVIIAVNQIGIAATIVNTFFMALVGALALALGLAFGLGGREVAAQMWQRWYAGGTEMAPRLQQAAAQKAEAAQTAPSAQSQPAARPQTAPPPPGAAPAAERVPPRPQTRPTIE